MPTKGFARCFSEVLRDQRMSSGMTQEQLAEKADLSSKMVSLIERGQRTPSITVAERIANGLSIPLWRLIKSAEDLRRK